MKIKDMSNQQVLTMEAKLRKDLPFISNRSEEYARKYTTWFMLRQYGVSKNLFRTFVVSGKESYAQN